MRKVVWVMIFAFVAAFSVNFCSANYYEYDPYKNDSNYVFIYTKMNVYHYFDLSSVDVQEYNPPHYQIAGVFVSYNSEYKTIHNQYHVMRYNWYTKETFTRDNYGNWKKLETDGDYMVPITNRKWADALFRAAYNMDFYGY